VVSGEAGVAEFGEHGIGNVATKFIVGYVELGEVEKGSGEVGDVAGEGVVL